MTSLESLRWVFPWLPLCRLPSLTQHLLLLHICSSVLTRMCWLLLLLPITPSLLPIKSRSILRILASSPSLLLLLQLLSRELLLLLPLRKRRRKKNPLTSQMMTWVSVFSTKFLLVVTVE